MNARLFLVCSIVTAAMAPDLLYVGKWKTNLAKSDFGQVTITLQSRPGGEWQVATFGITYSSRWMDPVTPTVWVEPLPGRLRDATLGKWSGKPTVR